MKAKIHVTLKSGVLDPQGQAIQATLDHMGFKGVGHVRVGKFIEVELAETSAEKAKKSVEQMCEKLLANTVVEKYVVEMAD
ncbi:MAG: phosphoribosylformylglycinamidine synthase [Rhodospirillales bacterium 12-54-5]|nr:MAG: phosphoribosylformylglycinamidine synthase [Rhodospirillales bacterium 12-54-5]